jgi:hypothetical protein
MIAILGAARRSAVALAALVAVACGGGGGGQGSTPGPPGTPGLEKFDAGFFSVQKPIGWSVTTAGVCGTFGFLLQDPAEPLRMVFYFGSIGPVYTTQQKKDLDVYACSFSPPGQCPITWVDAPVIDPLTPEGFLSHWPEIADMKAASSYLPAFPHLEGLRLASAKARPSMLSGGATAEVRGLFTRGNKVGEGMFLATSMPFMTGLGYGHLVCGISTPKGEFAAATNLLVASLDSFTVTSEYVNWCFGQSMAQWSAVAAIGRTLSEASDILWDGWVARTHTEDIMAEQYSDGFRGVDRVYDPATGTVYEVPVGWYASYDASRSQYQMSNLQTLPADAWDLWMKAVLSGSGIH